MTLKIFRSKLSRFWLLFMVTRLFFWATAISQPSSLWSDYYSPFISSFNGNPTLDPWSSWISGGGNPEAFPYGWTLLLILAPVVFLGEAFFGSSWPVFLALAVGLDLLVMSALLGIQKADIKPYVLLVYAASPVPLMIFFWVGATDIVPMAFLVAALVSMSKKWFLPSGLLLGLAVGTKFLIVVAVFGFLLYIFRSGHLRNRDRTKFVLGLIFAAVASASPVLYSPGFQDSLNSSEEATDALEWGIASSSGVFLLLPLIVLVSWLLAYQLRRMNLGLLTLTFATPLVLVAHLPGAPEGWIIWCFPVVLALTADLSRRIKVLVWVMLNFSAFSALLNFFTARDGKVSELIANAETTIGFLLATMSAYLLWRELVTKSDFVRLHSRPALVLIAGDSGVGKDTLAEGLARTLGEDSCVRVSGDDYHRWDRGEGAWKYLTHLNPATNELTRFFNDLLALSSGQAIRNGHYDHSTGKRSASKVARSREFVIASGLHALHINDVNRQSSLSIFLEMGEQLRADLKIARDTEARGHTREAVLASLEKRKADSAMFITPQREKADLVIKTDYIASLEVGSSETLQVSFTSEPKIFDDQLISELSVTCGLELTSVLAPGGKRSIAVIGEADSSSLSAAFERIEPRISNILGTNISWSSGSAGLVQMVTLLYLANALRRERLI